AHSAPLLLGVRASGWTRPTRTRSSRAIMVAPTLLVRVSSLCFFWVRSIESWLQRASAAASLRVTHTLSSVDIGSCLSAAAPVAACGMDRCRPLAAAQSPAMPAVAGRGLRLDGYPGVRHGAGG